MAADANQWMGRFNFCAGANWHKTLLSFFFYMWAKPFFLCTYSTLTPSNRDNYGTQITCQWHIKCIYSTAGGTSNKCTTDIAPRGHKPGEIKHAVTCWKPSAVHTGSKHRSVPHNIRAACTERVGAGDKVPPPSPFIKISVKCFLPSCLQTLHILQYIHRNVFYLLAWQWKGENFYYIFTF